VKELAEVTVTAQKAMIEEKVDRLVYNAEKDISAKGGDATDVLKKVPMLTVDLDGNVSLRGSQNIRVLINNKPSTIVASSVADALKQIPADMIKTVEVITSPSAKYDAEGSGGIINIITQKNTLQGLTLNIDSGLGNRGSNLGLNGSYRRGKLGFNLGGFGRAFYNKAAATLSQSTFQQGNSIRTQQNSTAFDNGLFGQYTLGVDYDLAKNQSLTAGLRYGVRNLSRDQSVTTNLFSNDDLATTFFRDVESKDKSGTVDVNVDYLRTFKPQQEWSISTQYSRNNLTNNFNANLLDAEQGIITEREQNRNNNTNQEVTLQTDFTNPIGKNQLVEAGAKTIFRTVLSDYAYFNAGPAGTYTLDLSRPAGSLDYSQNVGAGYVSYTYTTAKKYAFKLGTRYEHTAIDASTGENGSISIPNYSNLVPSLNVSKTLASGTTLKAAYNRRIQRPGLQQLNPNFNLANTQNIQVGNPNLRPELTDNFELGLSTNIKKAYVNVSLFTRLTDNAISQVRVPSDTLAGALITTFQNIGSQRSYGTNVFGNINLTQNWTVNGGIDLFYSFLEGRTTGLDGTSLPITNSGLNLSGRLMSQLQLPKGWGIQAFSFFRGSMVQLQGTQSGFKMYSLAVKKEFANKRGSIGLAGENFLTKGMLIRSASTSPVFSQNSTMHLMNQGAKVTFSYKIGKMSFDAPRRKTRSVSNDDVKGGEDSGNGGGQQPANNGTRPPR
jgi:outer membrane receptor protein involved in Fe transport